MYRQETKEEPGPTIPEGKSECEGDARADGGGLGVVVILVTAVFGAISGMATSAVATIGGIMIPKLIERGYSPGYACSLVAASAVLALTGLVNIPVIYFSVKWWNTLHQGASVSFTSAPTMAASMFTGMILVALAFWMYSIAAACLRVRSIILERERGAAWVAAYLRGQA